MATRRTGSVESRISGIDAQLSDLRLVKRGNGERKALSQEKRNLETQLRRSSKPGVQVSDHAIVRYMERVHGLDMEQIKREIVGCDPAKLTLPNGMFGVSGHRIRVIGGKVITVMVKEEDRT